MQGGGRNSAATPFYDLKLEFQNHRQNERATFAAAEKTAADDFFRALHEVAILRLTFGRPFHRQHKLLGGGFQSAVVEIAFKSLADDLRSGDQRAIGAVHHDSDNHDAILSEVLGITQGNGATSLLADAIDQNRARFHPATRAHGVFGEFDDAADFGQQDMIEGNAGFGAEIA